MYDFLKKGRIQLPQLRRVLDRNRPVDVQEESGFEVCAVEIGEGDPRVFVYIEIDDPQAYLDRAIQAGGTVLMPVMFVMKGVTIAMVVDPEGSAIGLLQALPI